MFNSFDPLSSTAAAPAWQEYVVDQCWSAFSAEDHAVWDTLYTRQVALLGGRIVSPFLDGLDLLDFVTLVQQELLLDIEVVANGARPLGGAAMDAFFDALSGYLAVVESASLPGFLGWLREAPGVTVIDFDGGHALFETADAAVAQSVLKRAVADGAVQRFGPRHPSLAQIFREVIQ